MLPAAAAVPRQKGHEHWSGPVQALVDGDQVEVNASAAGDRFTEHKQRRHQLHAPQLTQGDGHHVESGSGQVNLSLRAVTV